MLSAVLQVVIFPLADLYWLSWIAVTPLVIALLRARPAGALQLDAPAKLVPASPWQGFLLAYLCGILWSGGTCYWVFDTMHRYGGLPVLAAAFVLLLFCLYIGLYHGLFGLLMALVAAPRPGIVAHSLRFPRALTWALKQPNLLFLTPPSCTFFSAGGN